MDWVPRLVTMALGLRPGIDLTSYGCQNLREEGMGRRGVGGKGIVVVFESYAS